MVWAVYSVGKIWQCSTNNTGSARPVKGNPVQQPICGCQSSSTKAQDTDRRAPHVEAPDQFRWLDRGQRENNLFARFITRAGERMPSRLQSSWEILSVMQHYGVRSRMMDWTESLFSALYFAFEYKDKPDSPCIWLLNPFRLNKAAVEESNIFDHVDPLSEDAFPPIDLDNFRYTKL